LDTRSTRRPPRQLIRLNSLSCPFLAV